MSYLVPFLLGLVAAVVVQVWVVPRADTQKRRQDRWERRVDDLGELLTTEVRRSANEARTRQAALRYVLTVEPAPPELENSAARIKDDLRIRSRQATAAFDELVQTRVVWIAERIQSVGTYSAEIGKFSGAMRRYQIAAMMAADWREDKPGDAEFDEAWDTESTARRDLIGRVTVLLDMPHPPRSSARRRVKRWRERRGYERERKRLSGPPDPAVPARTVKLGGVAPAPPEDGPAAGDHASA